MVMVVGAVLGFMPALIPCWKKKLISIHHPQSCTCCWTKTIVLLIQKNENKTFSQVLTRREVKYSSNLKETYDKKVQKDEENHSIK